MIDSFDNPISIAAGVAQRVKQRRLEKQLTQDDISLKAGVPLATYRRFERTGQISFEGLLQIAFALGCLDEFRSLFATQTWATMDDMLNNGTKPKKRVRHG